MCMWEAILGLYMGLIIIISLVECLISIGLNALIFPSTIYEISKMNWFGTICVYILIFPFSFILGIGGFLKWLFTVGRK